jgi:hypothetical protein
MNELKGPPAKIRFTVTITRKATGAVETYDMVGAATPEQAAELLKEKSATNEQLKEQDHVGNA